MTDKQIIIDGVDVSGCANHIFHEDEHKCKCGWCKCESYPNCYFKQLKRKEQECEELKKNIKICWENLKISEENKKIQHEHWFQRCSEIQAKANDFEQTLTEIKELLLKTPTDSPIHCVNTKSVILQKISEVEDV